MRLEKHIRNIRIRTLKMTYTAQAEHIGSCFSCIEILASLYSSVLDLFSNNCKENYFILSKGHAIAVRYLTFCK